MKKSLLEVLKETQKSIKEGTIHPLPSEGSPSDNLGNMLSSIKKTTPLGNDLDYSLGLAKKALQNKKMLKTLSSHFNVSAQQLANIQTSLEKYLKK